MKRGKRIIAIIIAALLVVTMMPISAAKVSADTSDGPTLSDENYIKLIVDTGGKGNISLNEYAQEWYSNLISMRPGEPNVIYVDKEELEVAEEYDIDVGDILEAVDLPQVEGYHNGKWGDYQAYSFDDPSSITNFEQYEDATSDVWFTKLSEKAVNDEATVHAIWFKIIDKMTVEVKSPNCGDTLGEETVPEITAPSGEHWHICSEYEPYWAKWDVDPDYPDYGWYDLFEGTVKGDDEIVADLGFECDYGYCMNPDMIEDDITVKYTDWQGNKVNGSCERIVSLEGGSQGTGEYAYSEIGVKVKVQHVPGPVEKTEVVNPTCTEDGSHKEIIKCTKCEEVLSSKNVVDKAIGHNWGPWKVTKEPTATAKGEEERVCKNDSSHVQKQSIPAKGEKKAKKKSKKKTKKKAKKKTKKKTKKSNNSVLLVTLKSKGKDQINVKWTKVKGAKGYDIYFTRCNHNEKTSVYKKIKTVKGNKKFKFTVKGLKKNTAYKAYAKAWTKKKGKKKVLKTSPKSHVFTSGGKDKFTNAKKVSAKKKISVKKKKSAKIIAIIKKKSAKKVMPSVHTAKFRFISSNKKIAKVNKKGRIKGLKKGKCSVYVFTHNGAYKKIKVKVK